MLYGFVSYLCKNHSIKILMSYIRIYDINILIKHYIFTGMHSSHSERTISRIERCDTPPSAEFMLRISSYLNLLVEDIFSIKTD